MSANTSYPKKVIVRVTRGQDQEGPNTVIMAGVHGNEKGGVKAITELHNDLEIDRGAVYWIIANPGAVKRNVRCIDMNLNRAFKPEKLLSKTEVRSYERSLAKQIMPYLDM